MRKIEEQTCIKFEERSKNHHQELALYTSQTEGDFIRNLPLNSLSQNWKFHLSIIEPRQKDFIEFFPTLRRDCYSYVGRVGGQQKIVLFEGCADEHTLIHEVPLMSRYFIDNSRVNSE